MAAGGGDGFRLDIQGLRAIAVCLVVLFHSGLPVPGGFVGVDIFFVISGFVITDMLMRSPDRRVGFGRFYIRRFKRLTPALALLVGVVVAVSLVVESPLGDQTRTALTGAGAMLLVANLVIALTTGDYFDATADTNPLLHTWSLSVEEQFYLLFPLALAGAWAMMRRFRRLRWDLLLVGLLLTASMLVTVVGLQFSIPLTGFYSPLSRAWEFAAGALLAMSWPRWSKAPHWAAVASASLGLVLVGISAFAITGATPWPGLWTWAPVTATLLLLAAGVHQQPISQMLSTRAFTWVGDRSYSWYLWHWPFIVFALLLWPEVPMIAVLAGLLSLIPAGLSYRFLETPLRLAPVPRGGRLVRMVSLTMVIPLAMSVLLFAVTREVWGPQLASMAGELTARHVARERACFTWNPLTEEQIRGECTWNAKAPGAPIYVIGDSHADAAGEAAILAARQLDRPVTVLPAGNCAIVPGVAIRRVSGQESRVLTECLTYVNNILEWLSTQTRGSVVVVASDRYWWDPGYAAGPAPDGPFTADESEKLEYYREGLSGAVERLEGSGFNVVIAQAPPHWGYPSPGWNPQRCSAWALRAQNCVRTQSIGRVDALQGSTRQVTEQVAAATSAQIFDPRPVICDHHTCWSFRHGHHLYSDSTHLSVRSAGYIAPVLAAAIHGASSRSAPQTVERGPDSPRREG